MKLAFAIALATLGCGKDASTVDIDAPEVITGMVTEVSGTIGANATWQDTIKITGAITIPAGVTVTVMPGTTILVMGSTYGITIGGTLDIQGTASSNVTLNPTPASSHWSGVVINSGGSMIAHYLVEAGGELYTSGSAKLTLIDSQLSRAVHDLIVMSGGTLDVEYSSIGLETTAADTTHCDMHMQGAGNVIKVTHSNISTALYAIMFYGGTAADFTYDNWFQNTTTVDLVPGPPVSGDFSHGWFQSGKPTGTGITANNLATARLPVGEAGPRP
jgi:hypothetical protein